MPESVSNVDYRFRAMLDRGEWLVSVEVDPPPSMNLERGVEIVFELPRGYLLESSSIEPSTVSDSGVTFSLLLRHDTTIEARFVKEDGST